MLLSLWIIFVAIICLLFLSAFFSGSETALTAVSRAKMHSMEKAGNRRAALVSRLLGTQEKLIGSLLLSNNLVNILASALATSLFISLFGDLGVVYATLAMTALVLVFAEVMPKAYAIHHADKVALTIAPVLRVFVLVLAPIAHAVQALVEGVLRVFGVHQFSIVYLSS